MFTRIAGVSAAGFLLGIFYASLLPLSTALIVIALCVAAILLIASSVARVVVFAALFLCAGVLGTLRFDTVRVQYLPLLENHVQQNVNVVGVVVSEPDVRERNTRLTVDVASFNDERVSARMLVIVPAHTKVRYGDTVQAEGKLQRPKAFESGEGRSFDYPAYLATRGITYELSFADVRVVSHGGNPVKAGMIAVKSAYITGLRAVLPEPYAGLAGGITAGDKRSVGTELSDVFQRVSLVHILVLSGYNITIVLGAFMGLFARIPRAPRLLAVLFVVAFFVVISGGAASALRAGAMAFCAVVATLYGRQFVALRVLTLVVCVMVLWNPYLLVFDPGFQLSVLATLGLILVAPHIEHMLSRVPNVLTLREIAAATIATQGTVLPLLLYSNGLLSLVALPANLLALVAVPLAMLFSAVAAVAGFLFGTWGTLLAFPAYILLRYIVIVAEMCASLSFASVQVAAFSAWWLLPVYAILVMFVIALNQRHPLGSK